MKKRVCIFDVDEVLLDWMEGLRSFVEKHYDIHPVGLPSDFSLVEWLGVESGDVRDIIKHFNERAYEFGLLGRVEDDAYEYLRVLRKNFPDVGFIALTKSGTGGHGKVLRQVNLENQYPGIFDEVHIVEMYESKRTALHKLQVQYDVQLFVDDYLANITTAKDLGIRSIMFASSHNYQYKDSTEFEYIPNWYQLQRTISYSLLQGSHKK